MNNLTRRDFFKSFAAILVMPFLKTPPVMSPTTNIISGGIYVQDYVTIPAGQTWEAATGERVIFTRANGMPPTVWNFGTARNLWFGGTRETSQIANVPCENDTVFDGCTFFGYYGGVNAGIAKRVRLTNNRFVNCGGGLMYHPIYVANTDALEGEGTTIEDNIFIGGEGYPIHLYHMPRYNSVQRNFVARGLRCIAVEGDGNLVRDNIFWSNIAAGSADKTCVWLGQGSITFRHNLLGDGTSDHSLNYATNATVRKNTFAGHAVGFGDAQVHLETTDLKPLLGMGYGGINNTLDALEQAFTQTPAQLLNDATIEPNFAKLRGVVTKWAD